MPDFGIFRGFSSTLFSNKLFAGQLPIEVGLTGSESFAFDPDAQAFFDRVTTAGGSLSATEQTAINTLVLQMKTDGIWTKMKAIYPMVGASAAACAQNLRSSSFTGTFTSGWTFASTGATPNGTSAYMNSNFNPSSQSVVKSNFGVSFYSRTNSTGNYVDMGAVDGSSYIMIRLRNSGTDSIGVYDDSFFFGDYVSNSLGLFTVQRDSSTTQKFYQAGVLKAERTGFTATADINLNLYISARNLFNGTPGTFSNRECAFAAIHEAFNSTEISNYSSTVQAFQTTLSRQV